MIGQFTQGPEHNLYIYFDQRRGLVLCHWHRYVDNGPSMDTRDYWPKCTFRSWLDKITGVLYSILDTLLIDYWNNEIWKLYLDTDYYLSSNWLLNVGENPYRIHNWGNRSCSWNWLNVVESFSTFLIYLHETWLWI